MVSEPDRRSLASASLTLAWAASWLIALFELLLRLPLPGVGENLGGGAMDCAGFAVDFVAINLPTPRSNTSRSVAMGTAGEAATGMLASP